MYPTKRFKGDSLMSKNQLKRIDYEVRVCIKCVFPSGLMSDWVEIW